MPALGQAAISEGAGGPSRFQQRAALLETRRRQMETGALEAMQAAVAFHLRGLVARVAPRCVGLYWPVRGELDLRAEVAEWLRGAMDRQAGLPIVVAADAPLRFSRWTPECAMTEGRYRIPIPAVDTPVQPDLLLIPCVGFSVEADGLRYRLGYGGGFYDRTLAALPRRPYCVGIATAGARVVTLQPEAHDVPLDLVLTEEGPV